MPFEPKDFIKTAKEEIKKTIASDRAIVAVSGGVDSIVAATLAYYAISSQLSCVFVDTGLMRKNEADEVRNAARAVGLPLKIIDASDKFLSSLFNVVDPEEKRKVIGKNFIEIFEQEASLSNAKFLIQGTIAPDWIESGGGMRDKIKSHHNVGGLPQNMKLELCEPLRELYKDEVREVARELGIPKEFIYRQPFPGPGLAVRIIGEVTPEKVSIVREASAIVEEEIRAASLSGKMSLPWQYFSILLPVKTVGVLGDARAYKYTIAIRAVDSVDGMTAKASKIPHEVLESITDRITRSLKDHVNRVLYDVTSKPPATIEWE
ncbi:MAG: glutamine-hydrolyzing GMP synthase [Candidatus Anstonellales archaeon]